MAATVITKDYNYHKTSMVFSAASLVPLLVLQWKYERIQYLHFGKDYFSLDNINDFVLVILQMTTTILKGIDDFIDESKTVDCWVRILQGVIILQSAPKLGYYMRSNLAYANFIYMFKKTVGDLWIFSKMFGGMMFLFALMNINFGMDIPSTD